MRLLFVIDGLGSGGAQRQLVTIAKQLSDRGHEVEFFTYQSEDYFSSSMHDMGIKIHHRQKFSRFSLGPLFRLARLLRIGRYDVALAFLKTPSLYLELASLVSSRTKIVVSERSMFPPGKLPYFEHLLQRFHRLADAITVNSHHQRTRMIQEYPWMEAKLNTIYNGVDVQKFVPSHSVGGPGRPLRLLAISSVGVRKNSLNLAKAIQICIEKFKLPVSINWAGKQRVSGGGTSAFDETVSFLKAKGLSASWNWLGERKDIVSLLQAHDALVHASYFEGLPNVICEAMACGKPALAAKIGDHAELVGEGNRGFLFDPFDPLSIAKSIRALTLTDSSGYNEMCIRARQYAEMNLSSDQCTNEYEALFQKVVKS